MKTRPLLVLAVAALLAGCTPQNSSGLSNLGDMRTRAIAYHDSGAYLRDLAAVDAQARDYILSRASQVRKPALVLDIDETSLSNWPEMKADGFAKIEDGPCTHLPKAPCGTTAWQQMGKDAGIPPTVALAKDAQKAGVTLFFLTGRHEMLRAATARNLRAAGYADWKELILRPKGTKTPSAADYKAPQRARIEAMGYTIIANIGDQPSDLAGGHAERAFLLPNPFYRIP